MPMPDKFKCIRLWFIFMKRQSFIICSIDLSIASCSAAAFYAAVFAAFNFFCIFSLSASVLIFSAAVDSANFSCIESCKLLYARFRS